MSYYNQHFDPRYFAPNPQYPEPKKSSSWVGWLLIALSALIGGFFLGQNTKIENPHEPDRFNPPNDNFNPPNDDKLTSAAVVIEPEIVPKPEPPVVVEPVKFTDLSEEIVEKMTADFDNMSDADRLFAKISFRDNSELIEKYPDLAQLLGFEIEDLEDTNHPL
jgi:hypothetical protein